MITVFADTNVWLKEQMFKSGVGVSFVYFIKENHSKIILPEITKLELLHNVRQNGKSLLAKLDSTLSLLQVQTGEKPNFGMLSEDKFISTAEDRLHELSEIIEEREIELDDCRNALKRAIQKKPPCHKREEIRDALLWETVLRYAQENDSNIYLITNDKYDFNDEELRSEGESLNIKIVGSITDIIQEVDFKGQPEIDIWSMIETEVLNRANSSDNMEFKFTEVIQKAIEFYATENPDKLAFEFSSTCKMEYVEGELTSEGYVEIQGDGTTDIKNPDPSFHLKSRSFFDSEMNRLGQIINIHSPIVSRVPYSVRGELKI